MKSSRHALSIVIFFLALISLINITLLLTHQTGGKHPSIAPETDVTLEAVQMELLGAGKSENTQ